MAQSRITKKELNKLATRYDGDPREFSKLSKHIEPYLRAYYHQQYYQRLGNQHEDEAVIRTLTALQHALITFKSNHLLINYCTNTLRNQLSSYLRRSENKHYRSVVRRSTDTPVESMSRFFDEEERNQQVTQILRHRHLLTHTERSVILLTLAGHNLKEIREHLGITRMWVYCCLESAKNKLITEIKHDKEATLPE